MDHFVELCEGKSFSDKNLSYLCEGRVNVLEYGDLAHMDDIDQALGEHGAAIILYETRENYGHWCALIRTSPISLEWFDPYGGAPDSELQFVPDYFRHESHQDYPHLTALIANSRYRMCEFNDIRLQQFKRDVNTCGRWCGLRVAMAHDGVSLPEFIDLFTGQKMRPDWYVTAFTLFLEK